jgi:hypothetical protein
VIATSTQHAVRICQGGRIALVLTGGARRAIWAALWLLVAALAAAVIAPLVVLRPFAPQSAGGLALAFRLRRLAPSAAWAALAAAALFAWLLWPGARWRGRAALGAALLALGAAAWIARLNPFERMFAPLPERGHSAATVAAAAADFVAPGEMVLAVAQGGEEVAYPVRQVAYHHVVADTVGGMALAVTY